MKFALPDQIWHGLPRLLNPQPSFRIVFHHIPKCGGTSVSRAIRRCLPLDSSIRAHIGAEASNRAAGLTGRPLFEIREELLLYYMSHRRMAYISGHVPFSEAAFEAYASEWSFVTIIRHPVARWFSQYFYNRSKPHGAHARLSRDLDEHLESPDGKAWGTAYIRFFSGSTGPPRLDRALEMARHFAVIGVLEDVESFTREFKSRFSRRLKVPHINRGPDSAHTRRSQIEREFWNRVEEVCKQDMELYESVRSGALSRGSRQTPANQPTLLAR